MDPNENVAELRVLVKAALESGDTDEWSHLRMAELVEALDEWLTNGGFLPEAWKP